MDAETGKVTSAGMDCASFEGVHEAS